MSEAIESQGFELEIGNGDSPLSYTEVKEIKRFTLGDGEASEIDVTHLKSPAKEFKMGLQDWGNSNLELNYVPNDPGQMLVRAAKGTRALQNFRATFSNGDTVEFTAFVKNAPRTGAVDDVVNTSFNLRITGDLDES